MLHLPPKRQNKEAQPHAQSISGIISITSSLLSGIVDHGVVPQSSADLRDSSGICRPRFVFWDGEVKTIDSKRKISREKEIEGERRRFHSGCEWHIIFEAIIHQS